MAARPTIREVVGFVRVERDPFQGYRSLKSIKSFWTGEVVARERAIVDCGVDRDTERLRAYIVADAKARNAVMQCFSDIELNERNYVVAPEEAEQVLAELQEQLEVNIDAKEAAAVLSRWAYSRHVNRIRIYQRISTLRHSCAAFVEFEHNLESDMGVLTARGSIAPQTRLGMWLLEDVSLWWKGANIRSEALCNEGYLNQVCCCERCQGNDTCRAIKCPGCEDYHKRVGAASALMLLSSSAMLSAAFAAWRRLKSTNMGLGSGRHEIRGEVTRNGKLKRWRCSCCDFDASDVAVEGMVRIETQLGSELADVSSIPMCKLTSWVETVGSRLGVQHWLCASLWFEIYRRQTDQKGEFTFMAALVSLRIFEWFLTRKLASPPQPLINQLSEMMFRTLVFLQSRITGVRDLRVLYLRAIDLIRNLIENIDRGLLDRFKPFAGTAHNIRRKCAFCQATLSETGAEEVNVERRISEDDEGTGPVLCSFCMDLGYCDTGCQMADWPRHRLYCVPMGSCFSSALIGDMLVAY